MYENGRKLNRYASKMIHKRKMKQRYMNYPYGGLFTSWEDFVAHDHWDPDLRYWWSCSFSSIRSWVSRCASRKLRNEFKHSLAHDDYEDIVAPQRGQFKKYFDYWWIIF